MIPEKIDAFQQLSYLVIHFPRSTESILGIPTHVYAFILVVVIFKGRFFSGMIFRHPALSSYKYYMRLDDDSFFLCNVSKDPFSLMRQKKAKYGWIVEFFESPAISGETLWNATKKVIVDFPSSQIKVYERKQHPEQVHIGGSELIWRLYSLPLLEQFRTG